MSKKPVRILVYWLMMILGVFISAAAYRMYFIPNDIVPGGFTGIGQLVNFFTGWPIGLMTLLLNIPLFLLTWRRFGIAFIFRSTVALVLFSLGIDHLSFIGRATTDPMLATVFGGLLAGIGFGLILRFGFSTGGSDMLGTLIHDHFPVFKVSTVTLAVDVVVIGVSAFVFDATSAMFALIGSYLFSHAVDLILEGSNSAKAYYIISPKGDIIARAIITNMERGCTKLAGQGMYSGEDKPVLLCVINRFETVRLRNIIAQIDPNAFVIATNVTEALGEGFKPHVKM